MQSKMEIKQNTQHDFKCKDEEKENERKRTNQEATEKEKKRE